MNAIQVVQKLKDTISIEQRFLENVLLHRDSSVAGADYVHANDGRFSVDDIRGRVNLSLIRHCQLHMGFCLINKFGEALYRKLADTELAPLAEFLKSQNDYKAMDVSEFLDNLVSVLGVDEQFFERLLAHALVFDKLDKFHALDSESAKSAESAVKFNNFSLDKLASVEDGYFFAKARDILSFIILLNRVGGTEPIVEDLKQIINDFELLDAFNEKHATKEFSGVKVTALKGGKVKFTLSKNMAEAIAEKVSPHLNDFKLLFIDANAVSVNE